MKREFRYCLCGYALWVVFMMLGLTACDNDKGENPLFKVNVEEVEIGCDGDEFNLEVVADSPWTVSSTCDWLTVTPSHSLGNGKILVKVQPNQGDERTAEIVIRTNSSAEAAHIVEVRQLALGSHQLSLSPMVVALENGNLESEVTVSDSPHGWTFDIKEGASWMEVSKSDGKLMIVADPLRVPYRTGIIEVTSVGQSVWVYVVQGEFRTVPTDRFTANYYGRLKDEADHTTILLNAVSDKYSSPYVGQEYQDYIMLQLNVVGNISFVDYRVSEGRFPFSMGENETESYCSPGFFDDEMGVYGSCWLKRWFYMEQDYGFAYLSIFRDGAVYVANRGENTYNLYIVGTGYNEKMEPETYTLKISGSVEYVDLTDTPTRSEINKI